jgi:hypothetical protein
VRFAFMSGSTALTLPGWRSQLNDIWEHPNSKKARRVAFHVVRGAKKFLLGTGNAAWIVGTTILVMVMPLAFEIEREESMGMEGAMTLPPK